MTHMHKVLTLACLAFGAWGLSLPAVGGEKADPVYTVYGGYSHAFADANRLSEDGPGYFVGGSSTIGRHFSFDLSLFGHRFEDDTNVPGAVDWSENGVKGDVSFHFLRKERFSPYASLGVGFTRSEEGESGFRDDGVFGDAGVGFVVFPSGTGRLGFVADVRYRLMEMYYQQNDSFGEVIARAGLVWRVTPFPRREVVQAAPVNTAASFGPEMLDPAAGAGTGVALGGGSGSSSSGPGADDSYDRMQLRGVVYFDFDRYDIRGEQLDAAEQIADAVKSQMKDEGQVQVQVDGHTDAMGSSGYNMALGERRALAVKEFLIRKGIDPASIQINSLGESRPAQTNETEEGRAFNRRAEVLTSGNH